MGAVTNIQSGALLLQFDEATEYADLKLAINSQLSTIKTAPQRALRQLPRLTDIHRTGATALA